MFELLDGLMSLLSSSIGLIVGCVAGVFVSCVVYYSLTGHETQIELSALAFIACAISGLIIETSLGKQK